LRSLRAGKTPEEAHAEAKQAGTHAVQNWNEKTSKGRVSVNSPHELKRWEGAGAAAADHVHAMFKSSLGKAPAPAATPPPAPAAAEPKPEPAPAAAAPKAAPVAATPGQDVKVSGPINQGKLGETHRVEVTENGETHKYEIQTKSKRGASKPFSLTADQARDEALRQHASKIIRPGALPAQAKAMTVPQINKMVQPGAMVGQGRSNRVVNDALHKGFVTDGKFMLKLPDKELAKVKAARGPLDPETPNNAVQRIIDSPHEDTPAQVVGHRLLSYGQGHEAPQTMYQNGNRKALVDSNFEATIKKRYPQATVHLPESNQGPLIYKHQGNVVGLAMPLHGVNDKEVKAIKIGTAAAEHTAAEIADDDRVFYNNELLSPAAVWSEMRAEGVADPAIALFVATADTGWVPSSDPAQLQLPLDDLAASA
jgi:hypothetical protein